MANGQQWRLTPLLTPPLLPEPRTLVANIEAHEIAVVVSEGVLDALCALFDPGLSFARIDDADLATLLLAQQLEPLLADFAAALGGKLRLTAAEVGGDHDALLTKPWRMSFTVHADQRPLGHAVIHMDDALANRLTQALHVHAAKAPQPLNDLPIPVRACALSAYFSQKELRGLAVGDALLGAHTPITRNEVVLIAAERLAARAWIEDGAAKVQHRFMDADRTLNEMVLMADDDRAAAQPETMAADFDEVPVLVRAELATLNLPLKELRGADTGTVLPFKLDAEAPVTLTANGKPVGRGRLVKVGDELAVQIVAWFPDA